MLADLTSARWLPFDILVNEMAGQAISSNEHTSISEVSGKTFLLPRQRDTVHLSPRTSTFISEYTYSNALV